MKKTITAITASVALTACEASDYGGSSYPTDDVIHVRYDEGGMIEEYQRRIAAANARGQTFLIDGPCMSACTMYLGADNVVVTDRADFKFHGAIPLFPGETRAKWNEVMSAYYSEELREWFYSSGASNYTIVFMELPLDRVLAMSPGVKKR